MDYFRRNFKAIAGAVVGVLSVLVPAFVTSGTISPQDWGFAVAALIGGHQVVFATPANKVTVEHALGVLLPVLSARSPYAAETLKAVITAVPEYVPTVVPESAKPPAAPSPAPDAEPASASSAPPPVPQVAGPITPAPSVEQPASTPAAGPIPPVSAPVGATAAPTAP